MKVSVPPPTGHAPGRVDCVLLTGLLSDSAGAVVPGIEAAQVAVRRPFGPGRVARTLAVLSPPNAGEGCTA